MNVFTRLLGAAFVSIGLVDGAHAQCLEWQPGFGSPGANADVTALCVFDDGSGPALYAGGSFDAIGGVRAIGIAKWDGATWSPLGSGVTNNGFAGHVYSLVVFDDGRGPALHAAGTFTRAGDVAVSHVARWDGTAWEAVGSGLGGNPAGGAR